MSVWIKICGTTSLADAELAIEAGADAVGFVFAPGPRRVSIEQVAEIAPGLAESVEKIGVFAETTLEEIELATVACGLTGVQLHFDAAPELTARLRGRLGDSLRILRVVRIAAEAPGVAPTLVEDTNADAVLVDSCSKSGGGGTGISYNWELAGEAIFRRWMGRRFIAAGGLNAENVAEAITRLAPWGVDVASGTESAPGRKDAAKVRAFIARAREAGGK